MNKDVRFMVSVIKARSPTLALSCLRIGGRDTAMEILENEVERPNVAKAVEYLTRRQRPLALAALETELDQRIVALGALPESLEPSERDYVVECLRSIRDYRRENPRRFEADLGYFNKESLDKTRDLWDRAEQILNQIQL